MKLSATLSVLFTLVIMGCSSNEQSNVTPDSYDTVLGKLQHGFTLNQPTQEKFNEGLLLLHNFEYEDALEAFEAATKKDSTEVMTHWGEAMCHYKALWRLQNTDKGKDIIKRLGSTKKVRLTSINDPVEKAMWEIVEIMYGEGEFKSRNQSITKHLAAMHEKYPMHQEIAAFYALSLIWSTEEYGNGSDDLRLAASITDKITSVNPLHPGALHYKIHALDGPTSAKAAIDAANSYAKVAADAAHALHMPSHIYLALGEWSSVVSSNQKSYDASVERMKRLELEDGSRGYHSLAWLHYGLLQQGKYAEAEKILNDMLSLVPKDPTKGARGYLLGMQGRQISETGVNSKNTILDVNVDVDDIGIVAQSVRSSLRAQLAFQNDDVNVITEEIDWLSKKIIIASQEMVSGGLAMCSAGTSRYAPTENSVKNAEVILSQIRGMKALLEDREDQYEVHINKAVELEEKTNLPSSPPKITKPSFELLGEWLLKKEQYAEAIQQFDKALTRMPRRSKSLIGKMEALRGLNKKEEVDIVKDELQSILANADVEVRGFLD